MKEINYEKFLNDLVAPLVVHQNDVVVNKFDDDGNTLTIQILVHPDDVGRVIGKKGRVINSIRTIAHACAARDGKKVEISVDALVL